MTTFAETVDARLRELGIGAAARRAAVDDLAGLEPATLGDPRAYADAVAAELSFVAESPDGLSALLRRGWAQLSGARERSRVWDPQNPHLFVPRAFGWGWRVNVGALAVRLGWVRPDDVDADVVAAIPPVTRVAARSVPALLAVGTGVAALTAIRAGRPVALHLDAATRADRMGDPRWLLAPTAVAVGAAAWGASPAEGDDAVARPAIAASIAGTCALLVAAALAAREDRRQPWVVSAVLVSPVAIELAMTVWPTRAGVRRVVGSR